MITRSTLLALMLLLLLPTAASASGTITWADPDLSWIDDAGQASTITVSFDAKGAGVADDMLVFTANSAITVDASAAATCPVGNGTTTVECRHRPDGVTAISFLWLNGLDLDDVITMAPSMTEANIATTTPELNGGDGADQIVGSTTRPNYIYGGAGNDTLTGGDSFDEIVGGDGSDTIDGKGMDDDLYGDNKVGVVGAGDFITGGTGPDDIFGGPGDDEIQPDAGLGPDGSVDVIDGGETGEGVFGDRVVLGSGWAVGATVTIADGNNNDGADNENYDASIEGIDGTEHDDDFTLGGGSGYTYGNGGADTIRGDAGANVILGGDGDDVLTGGNGADTLYGDSFVLGAGDGDDDLDGGAGADGYIGGGGDDLLRNVMDDAIDTFNGGDAAETNGDTITYEGSATGVTVTMDQGGDFDGDQVGDLEDVDLTIEHVIGTAQADDLTGGSAQSETLRGLGGNDTLTSLGGIDTLIGGTGTDTYQHSGNSFGIVSFAEDVAAVNLVGLNATIDGAAETLAAAHETIVGSPQGDTLVPAAGVRNVYGMAGDDTIDMRDGIADATIDCGAGAADVARFDTVAAGGVDDPAPVDCESLNPAIDNGGGGGSGGGGTGGDGGTGGGGGTGDPAGQDVATRFAAPSARLIRFRCTRAQAASGVRDGRTRWCYRLVSSVRVMRTDTGAALAGQRVNVFRVVAGRQLLLQRTTTNARGVSVVRRNVVVPLRHRASPRAANRWLASQYRVARYRHAAATGFTAASVTGVRIRR